MKFHKYHALGNDYIVLCPSEVGSMPSGELAISVRDDFSVRMSGAVTKVADGTICDEMFEK